MPHEVVQADAMKKSPRTWNRRDFNVVPNGLYTILKSAGWFAAWRLPGGFRYLVPQPKGTASPQAHENPPAVFPSERTFAREQKAQSHADSQKMAILSQGVMPSTRDHRPLRLVFIVLAATAITAILLWWLWWMKNSACYWYCG
jgi:hypothetical protein